MTVLARIVMVQTCSLYNIRYGPQGEHSCLYMWPFVAGIELLCASSLCNWLVTIWGLCCRQATNVNISAQNNSPLTECSARDILHLKQDAM